MDVETRKFIAGVLCRDGVAGGFSMVCFKSIFWSKEVSQGPDLVAQIMVGTGASALLVPFTAGGSIDLAGSFEDIVVGL